MFEPFNGILCSPHSFYDEGIDHVLTTLRDTASINAIVVYAYQGMTPGARQDGSLADHGKPIEYGRKDDAKIWVDIDEAYFRDTSLHPGTDEPEQTHAGRRIYADLEEPTKQYGMEVHCRVLEGWSHGFRPGFFNVHEIDCHGRPLDHPCYNNPDYQRYWIACTHNVFAQHPYLAGMYYGSERNTPLSALLGGTAAGCFCPYCKELAEEQNMDPLRAAEGFRALLSLVQRIHAADTPIDGAFVSVMRVLIEYPEILGWEKLWKQSYSRLPRLIHGVMKALNPELRLGWHGDNGTTGVHPLKRIATDYSEMTDYYDWIKPCTYHLATAPRMKGQLRKLGKSIFADLSLQQILDFQCAISGWPADEQPAFNELAETSSENGRLSTAWLRREIDRAVRAVDGKADIYAGPGIGVPVGGPAPENPDLTYEDCAASLDAGANGLLTGREYDEIPLPNLEAVGRAWREWRG